MIRILFTLINISNQDTLKAKCLSTIAKDLVDDALAGMWLLIDMVSIGLSSDLGCADLIVSAELRMSELLFSLDKLNRGLIDFGVDVRLMVRQ